LKNTKYGEIRLSRQTDSSFKKNAGKSYSESASPLESKTTVDFPAENRVPTGMLRAPLDTRIFPSQTVRKLQKGSLQRLL